MTASTAGQVILITQSRPTRDFCSLGDPPRSWVWEGLGGYRASGQTELLPFGVHHLAGFFVFVSVCSIFFK